MANNKKVDLLGGITSMVESQKGENAAYKMKKETEKPEMEEVSEAVQQKENFGRRKKNRKIERSKLMAFTVDADTKINLNFLKIQYGYDMQDVIFVLVRDFLEKNYQNRELTKEGKAFLEERLKDL